MGQAKARGTREERLSAAVSRDAEIKRLRDEEKARECEANRGRGGWARPDSAPRANTDVDRQASTGRLIGSRSRMATGALLAAITGLAAGATLPRQRETTKEDIERMFK